MNIVEDLKHRTTFLSIKEVATLLNVKPSKIARMVRRGELQAVHMGYKSIRIDPATLVKLLEGTNG